MTQDKDREVEKSDDAWDDGDEEETDPFAELGEPVEDNKDDTGSSEETDARNPDNGIEIPKPISTNEVITPRGKRYLEAFWTTHPDERYYFLLQDQGKSRVDEAIWVKDEREVRKYIDPNVEVITPKDKGGISSPDDIMITTLRAKGYEFIR